MTKILSQELLEWADAYLDDDQHQQSCESLGTRMFKVFGTDKGKISSQVRNLQSITNSATRFFDVELFIKNQLGREGTAASRWGQLGSEPLQQLSQIASATNREDTVCSIPEELRDDAAQALVALRLHLVQGWVRAVVAGYLFAKAQSQLAAAQPEGQG